MASEKVLQLIEDVKALTVLELADLVKALEEEFGVSAAAAPVAVAAAPAAAAAAEEEKSDFDVILVDFGQKKMDVIKLVKEITGLGLKESKELVDSVPKAIKEGASKADAEDIQKKLSDAGAKVELK